MNKYKRLVFASGFAGITLAFTFFSFATSFSENSPQETSLDRYLKERRKKQISVEALKFENKTKGLTIVSKEKDGDTIKLRLRNDYKKVITAYEIAAANMTTHIECLTGADHDDLFLPGDIREEFLSVQPDIDKLGIRILAVVFEDGTADGLREYIDEIRQYRLGMKKQREHSLTLLENIANSNSDDMQSAIANLELHATRISEEKPEELPYFVRRGLQDEQNRFLNLIQRISALHSESAKQQRVPGEDKLNIKKHVLSKIIEHYTKTIKQL